MLTACLLLAFLLFVVNLLELSLPSSRVGDALSAGLAFLLMLVLASQMVQPA